MRKKMGDDQPLANRPTGLAYQLFGLAGRFSLTLLSHHKFLMPPSGGYYWRAATK